MHKLELRGVSHWFLHQQTGEHVHALSEVELVIEDGEFVTLVRPSGCGKTTLLNSVAGFIKPSQGTLLFDGRPITGPGRDRGVVFQDLAILPWRTVSGTSPMASRSPRSPRTSGRSAWAG